MTDETFDDDALINLVGYFAERVNLVFAYFYCVIMFEDDEDFTANPFDNGRAWALQTIRDACLHSTLIALRGLDDVIKPRTENTREDDLRLSDFGYTKRLSFLTKSERERINKEIAHATLPGSEPAKRRWDIFELATKGVRQSLTFMKWVQEHFASTHPAASLSTIYFRTRTESTYDYFAQAVAERTQKKTAHDASGNA
jgi:hypothetical protein